MARKPRRVRSSMDRFFNPRSLAALSIKDLLEARDAHHVHLANLPNVVGTAIGLYRIRKRDRDSHDGAAEWHRNDAAPARTLFNSVIRPWSMPCVLVFVENWAPYTGLRERPDDVVPSWIYLPDGRRAPVCVIHAPHQPRPQYEPRALAFPTGLMGGSYPVVTQEQGTQRVGTIACLVSDDRGVYALTNRHVVGQPGTLAYTVDRGELRRIGQATDHSVGKERLEEVYPGWIARRTLINVDAGLFRVDDLSAWTSQIYGLGRLGQPIDLSVDTMSLGLIGCPVRGFGGVSGEMLGSVQALFYRYRTVGGASYVADFVIGPREGFERVETQPGDSGTLWVYDEADDVDDEFRPSRGSGRFGPVADKDNPGTAVKTPLLRPLAMQWGGHSTLVPGSDEESRFVLATTIANVCRLLDVELVRDWAIEHSEYWGKVGHYKIGWSACLRPYKNLPRLRALLRANAANISVSDDDVRTGQMPKANQQAFVALSDVPDLVWRYTRKKDVANHFADMDQPADSGTSQGKTLMQLWQKDPASRTPQKWNEFYDHLAPPPKLQHRGALPFRVKQLFEEMVRALNAGNLAHFVCVAGVLAHYVGDACQPLHVSHLHHGNNADEEQVHSVYETVMLDSFSGEYIDLLNSKLAKSESKPLIGSGDAAADATVALMRRTIRRLRPQDIIDVFNEVRGRGQTANMWSKLKTDTVAISADGVLTLACLWSSAWTLARAEKKFTAKQAGKAIDRRVLADLYNDPDIAAANWLKDM
jgi:hypothetical protein